MPLIIGDDNIQSIYFGDNKIGKAYLGDDLVYSGKGKPYLGKWQQTTTPFSRDNNFTYIAFGNGLFVAVTANSDRVAYSRDGKEWNESKLPSASKWSGIAYGNGRFVVDGWKSNVAAYSTNAIDWEESTIHLDLLGRKDNSAITFGGGKFVAVGYSLSGDDYYAISTDGKEWQVGTIAIAHASDVAYGNGVYVALGRLNHTAAYSTDGLNWSKSNVPNTSGEWYYVTFGNGKFLATRSGYNGGIYSIDGKTWQTIDLSGMYKRKPAYGDGVFLILSVYKSSKSLYCTSSSLNKWIELDTPNTDSLCDPAYGNGMFVTMQYGSNIVWYNEILYK